MKRLIQAALMMFLLAVGGQTFAQEKDEPNALASEPAPKCFTSGSGKTFMRVCITHRGNVTHFQSPYKIQHISTREGYAVCSGFFDTYGFDSGDAQDGWGAPTVAQPNGAGKLPLIITRRSTDGKIQLTQTFNINPAEREVSIKVNLKNTSTAALQDIVVARYFDGDIDNTSSDDIYNGTPDTVFATNAVDVPPFASNGLMLTTTPSPSINHFRAVETFGSWNPNGIEKGARRCFPAGTQGVPTLKGDFVGRMIAQVGALNPGQTRSATFIYRRF